MWTKRPLQSDFCPSPALPQQPLHSPLPQSGPPMMHHHPDAMEGVEVHHVQAHNPPPNHQPQNMNMNMNMMGIEPVRSSLPLEPSSRKKRKKNQDYEMYPVNMPTSSIPSPLSVNAAPMNSVSDSQRQWACPVCSEESEEQKMVSQKRYRFDHFKTKRHIKNARKALPCKDHLCHGRADCYFVSCGGVKYDFCKENGRRIEEINLRLRPDIVQQDSEVALAVQFLKAKGALIPPDESDSDGVKDSPYNSDEFLRLHPSSLREAEISKIVEQWRFRGIIMDDPQLKEERGVFEAGTRGAGRGGPLHQPFPVPSSSSSSTQQPPLFPSNSRQLHQPQPLQPPQFPPNAPLPFDPKQKNVFELDVDRMKDDVIGAGIIDYLKYRGLISPIDAGNKMIMIRSDLLTQAPIVSSIAEYLRSKNALERELGMTDVGEEEGGTVLELRVDIMGMDQSVSGLVKYFEAGEKPLEQNRFTLPNLPESLIISRMITNLEFRRVLIGKSPIPDRFVSKFRGSPIPQVDWSSKMWSN